MTCSECSNDVHARGMCSNHYSQARRRAGGFTRPTDEERFWPRVDRDGPLPRWAPFLGQCWLWTGPVNVGGYGTLFHEGRSGRRAHVVAYTLSVGPIPTGYEVDHLCRVKLCVNPDHLEAVTTQVNVWRSGNACGINANKTHCIHGHPLSGENLYLFPDGRRDCRTCRHDRDVRRRAKRRASR